MKSFIKSHRRSESLQSQTSTTPNSPLASPIQSFSNPSSPKKLLKPIKNLFHKRRLSQISEFTLPVRHEHSINKPVQHKVSMKSKKSIVDSDNSSEASNDSQFSFVKDIIGGRNTSIKYYKTKVKKEPNYEGYFEADHDIDVEDDYDYENNGLDDLDDGEEEINYIDDGESYGDSYNERSFNESYAGESYAGESYASYRDGDSYGTTSYQENGVSTDTHSSPKISFVHNKIPFHHSYHLSIDGKERSTDNLDVLESYLEIDQDRPETPLLETPRFQVETPRFQAMDDLQLFDLNSPLINGITLGGEENTRFKNSPMEKVHPSIKSLHLSIDEIDVYDKLSKSTPISTEKPPIVFGGELQPLDTKELELSDNTNGSVLSDFIDNQITSSTFTHPSLAQSSSLAQSEIDKTLRSLEARNTVEDRSDSPTVRINRQSINEMMNLLENLQVDNESSQKTKRDSIENMMNFLKTIQKAPSTPSLETSSSSSSSKPKPKPKPIITELKIQEEKEEELSPIIDDNELYLNELEKDLIDEVNQLPEDFDFDASQELVDQFNKINRSINQSFLRSNSFNKRPKKILPSNLNPINNNKIETSNKTVTFYGNRSKSNSFRSTPLEDLSTISEKH